MTARPLSSAAAIREDLQGQLTNRVRWTESVSLMADQGVTTFIELGSGTVLGGLNKRIAREAANKAAGTPADFEKLA